MQGENYRPGVVVKGVRTPLIQKGDDLQEIVINSVMETISVRGWLKDGDIIAVTEAVVAISQGNFVTQQNISDDIASKFEGKKELVIVDPIQSRNRFLSILKAIAATSTIEKLYIVMTYPTDEVGNRLVSDMKLMESGINPYKDVLTVEEFYSKLGEPEHPFTGLNYIQTYLDACQGKGEVLLCNDFSQLPSVTNCEDYLVCSIHRREETKMMLKRNGARCVMDLSQIMNKSVNGSGYNSEYGLYGSNLMSGNRLKLMPRYSKAFVNGIQNKIKRRFGVNVEVMVYGDGAFKDPVGGIWELADPQACLAATSGLKGTPTEVKLKYIASANEGKSAEEIEAIIAEEKAKRKREGELNAEASLGTTPRRITDLLASLADLTTGSGDRQTPVVLIRNYL